MSKKKHEGEDWPVVILLLIVIPAAFTLGGAWLGITVFVIGAVVLGWNRRHKGPFPTDKMPKSEHVWTEVHKFGNSRTFVDRTSIRHNGNRRQVRVRFVLDPPGTDKRTGKLIGEMRTHEEYDLDSKQFRVHRMSFVYTDGMQSEPLSTAPEWRPATEGNKKTLDFLSSVAKKDQHRTNENHFNDFNTHSKRSPKPQRYSATEESLALEKLCINAANNILIEGHLAISFRARLNRAFRNFLITDNPLTVVGSLVLLPFRIIFLPITLLYIFSEQKKQSKIVRQLKLRATKHKTPIGNLLALWDRFGLLDNLWIDNFHMQITRNDFAQCLSKWLQILYSGNYKFEPETILYLVESENQRQIHESSRKELPPKLQRAVLNGEALIHPDFIELERIARSTVARAIISDAPRYPIDSSRLKPIERDDRQDKNTVKRTSSATEGISNIVAAFLIFVTILAVGFSLFQNATTKSYIMDVFDGFRMNNSSRTSNNLYSLNTNRSNSGQQQGGSPRSTYENNTTARSSNTPADPAQEDKSDCVYRPVMSDDDYRKCGISSSRE